MPPWTREDQDMALEAIERQGVNLTAWEEDFIESVRDRFSLGLELTPKQVEILEAIYAKRTS